MASGVLAVDKLHDDGLVFAIADIAPRAPKHFIVIPQQHIPTAHSLTDHHGPLLAHMLAVANKLADGSDIAESGYRLTMNVGPDGGQSVYHLHMHVLGGAHLGPEA
jgi:histidine triad (HIT) family protein